MVIFVTEKATQSTSKVCVNVCLRLAVLTVHDYFCYSVTDSNFISTVIISNFDLYKTFVKMQSCK